MIYDKISNWNQYFKKDIFRDIFEKLEDFSIATENGEYHFEDGCYFKVMEYETKENPSVVESHLKEVDIQLILYGSEKIKMYHPGELKIKHEYNDTSDCIFYHTDTNPYTELILKPGYMAVFFPEDPHHPQFMNGSSFGKIKKIVIKVPVHLFN